MGRLVRIGVDVGGTFTKAVLLDNDTHEIIAQAVVPTTHTAAEGVAAGVIEAFRQSLATARIAPSDVVFIAHSTTQATNALLEGDVASVGIVGMGRGAVESRLARSQTVIGDIEEAAIEESAYSDSGWAIAAQDDEDDEEQDRQPIKVLVIK